MSESYVAAFLPKLEYGQQADPEIDTPRLQCASLFPASFATDWCGRFEAAAGSLATRMGDFVAVVAECKPDVGNEMDEAIVKVARALHSEMANGAQS